MTSAATPRTRWPGVWRADELAPAGGAIMVSGHPALDAALPGGGWPVGALVDLALENADTPWSALLLPGVARQARMADGLIALVEPPCEPNLPAFAASGVPPDRVLWLHAHTLAERLWLTEQALGCAGVAAVLAWLPGARTADLRRLHWAAARRAEALLFTFRAWREGGGGVPCVPLSIALSLESGVGDVPTLRLDVLRRRGPPMLAPIRLPAWNPVLETVLRANNTAVPRAVHPGAQVVPLRPTPHRATRYPEADHALDRIALAG